MGGSSERSNGGTRRYCWPASALTQKEMQMLYAKKLKTGRAISTLIREAVIRSLRQEAEHDEPAAV